jgi:Cu(I)/Ag(I) efflux system membrane fusion protein
MFATVTLKTPVAETPAFRGRLGEPAPAVDLSRTTGLTVAEQKVCPVTTLKLGAMGDPVPVEVEGKKVWTCCEACPPKLRAQPATYLARLAPAPKDEVLSVPESAVIDTGTRKILFVEAEPGVFEGREVVLGPLSGDLYPVLEGLSPGEKVATAGSFLLDAETRLNASAGPAEAPEHDEGDEHDHAAARPTRSAAAAPAAHRH